MGCHISQQKHSSMQQRRKAEPGGRPDTPACVLQASPAEPGTGQAALQLKSSPSPAYSPSPSTKVSSLIPTHICPVPSTRGEHTSYHMNPSLTDHFLFAHDFPHYDGICIWRVNCSCPSQLKLAQSFLPSCVTSAITLRCPSFLMVSKI